MKVAEIQTSHRTASNDWSDEWLTIHKCDGYVSFRPEFISPRTGERETWQDQGSGFTFEHLDAVIDALVRIRDGLTEND